MATLAPKLSVLLHLSATSTSASAATSSECLRSNHRIFAHRNFRFVLLRPARDFNVKEGQEKDHNSHRHRFANVLGPHGLASFLQILFSSIIPLFPGSVSRFLFHRPAASDCSKLKAKAAAYDEATAGDHQLK
jgi:hypothetical protein